MSKIVTAFETMQKLTKSEKRYISIIIKRTIQSSTSTQNDQDSNPQKTEQAKDGPSHLKLFGCISDVLKEEEETLAEEIVKSKYFQKAKDENQSLFTTVNITRLIDFLLTSLRQYSSDKEELTINNYIQNIHILQEKQLHDHAEEWIDKGLKLLAGKEKLNSYLNTLDLLRLKRKNIIEQIKKPEYETLFDLSNACHAQVHKIALSLGTVKDQEIMQEYNREEGFPDDFDPKEFSEVTQSFIEAPSLRLDIPLEAMLQAAFAASVYLKRNPAKYPNDLEKSILCTKFMVERFEQQKELQSAHPALHLKSLLVFVNSSISSGNLSHIDEKLYVFEEAIGMDPNLSSEDEFSKIQFDSQSSQVEYHIVNIMLLYYIGRKEYDTAYKLAIQVKDQIKKGTPRPDILSKIYFNLAGVFLLNKDFKTALKVNKDLERHNNMQKEPDADVSEFASDSKILEIIIRIENSHSQEELDNLIKGVGGFISKIGTQATEKSDSSIFLIPIPDPEDIKKRPEILLHLLFEILLETNRNQEKLEKLYKQIEALYARDGGIAKFHIFPIWARSKIESLS